MFCQSSHCPGSVLPRSFSRNDVSLLEVFRRARRLLRQVVVLQDSCKWNAVFRLMAFRKVHQLLRSDGAVLIVQISAFLPNSPGRANLAKGAHLHL